MGKEKVTCPAFTICNNLGTSRVACQEIDELSKLISTAGSLDTQISKSIAITLLRMQTCLSSVVLLLGQNQHEN